MHNTFTYPLDYHCYGHFLHQGGTSTRTFDREVPDFPRRSQDGGAPLEQTTDVDDAVMVACVEEEGEVIVRATSAGYNSRANCSFIVYLARFNKSCHQS